MPNRSPAMPACTRPATRRAVTDFLEFYDPGGNTRAAYVADLTIFGRWCDARGLDLLDVGRGDLEAYARHLIDDRGNKHRTMKRRMHGLRRFYAIAAADGHIPASPMTHVRLPHRYVDQDAVLPWLTRLELGQLLTTARAGWPAEAAFIGLGGMLGLRLAEIIGLQIGDYQHTADEHRVLRFVGKGGRPATIPLPVPVIRLLDAAAGDRTTGTLLIRRTGLPYNPAAARRMLNRLVRDAGIGKHITPHALRRSFASCALDAGVPVRDVQTAGRWSDPALVLHYDRARHQLDRHAAYVVATWVSGAA